MIRRTGFTKKCPMFWLVHKDLFCYFMSSMWAMNKCSYIQNMQQTMLHLWWEGHSAFIVKWVGDKIWKQCHSVSFCLRLSLSLSLSHIFGTIIPLFNWAVWSCFTPVHPHWLPFCPISPPLIRLCVINNDRQKMAVHIGGPHATPVPVIQFNTSVLCTQPSYRTIMYCFTAVSRERCKSGGLLFTLTDAQCSTMAPCRTYARPAKRGITAQ